MNVDRLIETALACPGASVVYKPEWDATLGRVLEKMFMMIGHDNHGRAIVTFKLDPSHGDALRQLYGGIMPGYYMNKTHWNSMLLDGSVPDDLIEDSLRQSYQLVYQSLTAKDRKRIDNE
ncbi:MAG: MmcQ/YjbR family DNA-binding protein [Acholeplasmataceae bacterium]|nr:MmcQ/YjbR family DNA-binding protein [Acholeplasmataceae bacterium]